MFVYDLMPFVVQSIIYLMQFMQLPFLSCPDHIITCDASMQEEILQ